MTIPHVSIIVPIYNVEKYFNRCLDSLLDQTDKNIEIILVDDESPDSCPKICDEAAANDHRVKVIHKKNQGLGLARNSGLQIATGEYVYFVDSDDYVSVEAVEKLYKAAKQDNLDICFAGIYLEDDNGNIKESKSILSNKSFGQPEIINIVLAGMMGLAPNGKNSDQIRMSAWQGIYRRSLIENFKVRFPSEREFISEDIIFHIDTLPNASSLKYLPDCLYYHIVDNHSSLTHRYNPERFNKCTVLYLEEIKRVSTIDCNGEMKLRAQEMYLGNVRVCLKQIVNQETAKGRDFVISEIREIINNEILRDVLSEYPYWKNPIKRIIVSFLIKLKAEMALYHLIKSKRS